MLLFIRNFESMIPFMCFNTIHHILSIHIHIMYFQQQVVGPWGVTLNSSNVIGHVSSFVRAGNNKLIYVWILKTSLYELLGLIACLVLLRQTKARRLANISDVICNIDSFLKHLKKDLMEVKLYFFHSTAKIMNCLVRAVVQLARQ